MILTKNTVTVLRNDSLDISDKSIFIFLIILLVLNFIGPGSGSGVYIHIVQITFITVVFGIMLFAVRGIPAQFRYIFQIIMYLTMISLIYKTMGTAINLLTDTWFDGNIIEFEYGLLGVHPTQWFYERSSVWLTEVMMFGYVIYLVMIPAGAYISYLYGGQDGMERFFNEWIMTTLICFAGYVLIPVAGPSRMLQGYENVVFQGYLFTYLTENLRNGVHLYGGAFPSAHCAVATVILVNVGRYSKLLFFWFFPLVLLVYISTVYGWFHYASDVVAGIIIAIIVLMIYPLLNRHRNRNYKLNGGNKEGVKDNE